MSLLEQMKRLRLREERKKKQRNKNTTKWVAYKTISKNLPPWDAELQQHIIEYDKFGCEQHSWRKIRKDRYAKPEPFIFPEDVDYQESCAVLTSSLPELVKNSIDSCFIHVPAYVQSRT